ncbi:hypothetical protein OIU14_13225 [Thalassobacter stenotrophicus]|uniref:hypothetical protein n=1 Tax=Thalassobacter stenotrophicus TaxID=266809 RepID=UPI0022A8FE2A|nr:hypothetical protein [Thalassobacter stenotrophicus]UYP67431.1 hypothetical protein OIU14_13225 [Thalassobacter stenotrophicus]
MAVIGVTEMLPVVRTAAFVKVIGQISSHSNFRFGPFSCTGTIVMPVQLFFLALAAALHFPSSDLALRMISL